MSVEIEVSSLLFGFIAVQCVITINKMSKVNSSIVSSLTTSVRNDPVQSP